jgi:CO dehydrogenase maturation factor
MQKIAISGKGGTGKSVLTTLLATTLQEEGYKILIVDSDESNPGLYRMLGFNRSPRELMEFLGGPQKVAAMAKALPVKTNEEPPRGTLIKENFHLQEIPPQYLLARNGLQLASVGKITKAFEGCACPMGDALKIFLDRLVLKEKELVIVDMEAGVEHFGRGVEKYIDTVLILVEPSFESIALSAKINLLAQGSGVKNIGAVLNKVTTPEIEHRLEEELAKRNIKKWGAIPYDEQISLCCLEGRVLQGSAAKESVRRIIPILLQA